METSMFYTYCTATLAWHLVDVFRTRCVGFRKIERVSKPCRF